MQIQENSSRLGTAEPRTGATESSRAFVRPSLGKRTDVFAEIFQAMASTSAAPAKVAADPPIPEASATSSDETESVLANDREIDDTEEVDAESVAIDPALIATQVQPIVKDAEPVVVSEAPVQESDLPSLKSERFDSNHEKPAPLNADETSNETVTAFDVNVDADAPPKEANAVESGEASLTELQQVVKSNELESLEASTPLEAPVERNAKSTDESSPVEFKQAISEPQPIDSELKTVADAESTSVESQVAVDGQEKSSRESGDDSSRDRRGRRDRSDARSNEPVRIESTPSAERQAATASSNGVNLSSGDQALAAETINSVPPPSANASTIAQPASVVTASVVGAGVVAVAASAPAGSSSSGTQAPDTLSIGSSAATPSESAAEPAAATKTNASRQTELADRARLVHRIAKAFQKMGVDGGHVRLKMHPEELGGVQLEMQVSGRKVSATVTAENEQARQVIQANLPELRQRLESQGLVVERLDVQTRNENENSGSNQQGQGFGQSESRREASQRHDGVWRRQDENRAGLANERSGKTADRSIPAAVFSGRSLAGSWSVDRGLDVKL